jgi:hypothetical protein
MVALSDLLEFGYFPRELPPIFSTASFAAELTNTSWIPSGIPRPSKAMSFSLGRRGTLRRVLSIPNPEGFANLAHAVASNWTALQAHFARDKVSITSPTPGRSVGRAVDPRFKLEAVPVRRAITRAGARYLVHGDVARFYPSIYTHTIPWAAHGKSIAKRRRRDRTLYGNLLDEAVRKCQDDQTVGIPIGPDTSLVLAELILSKVDAGLRGVASAQNSFRYIDDYEISCRTFREAEEALAALDAAVRAYELDLNADKSRIIELPTALYDPWKDSLAKFSFSAVTPAEDREEILRYFTLAFELRLQNPDAYVLNYAIGRLPVPAGRASNWRLIESLLLQCLKLEPGVTRYVVVALLRADDVGRRLNRDRISETLSAHIEEHTPLGHNAEVAWALWGAVELGLALTKDAVSAISRTEDAIVALLALSARKLAPQVVQGLRTSVWRPRMCADDLQGPHWLLAYEANVQGWLPSVNTTDHVSTDPFFGPLKGSGVSFLDLTAGRGATRLHLGIRGAASAFYL